MQTDLHFSVEFIYQVYITVSAVHFEMDVIYSKYSINSLHSMIQHFCDMVTLCDFGAAESKMLYAKIMKKS